MGKQLSKELDEQLPDQLSGLVGESILKTSSKRKRKQKKNNRANKGTTHDNARNLSLVNVEEVSGLTESGEVEELPVVSDTQPTSNTTARGRFYVGIRGANPSRGRGRRPFVRQTGESDPYDMFIAPINIYENQVLPIGIHSLSKSFRPKLATIQVYRWAQNLYLNGNSKKETTHSNILTTSLEECIIRFTSHKLNQGYLK